MDINAILTAIHSIMGFLNVPTQLGQNFSDFVELVLIVLLFPVNLIQGWFGG